MSLFLTPDELAARLVADAELTGETRVLEPGFGEGAFLVPLAERFVNELNVPAHCVFDELLHGVELDVEMYARTYAVLDDLNPDVAMPLLEHKDFFRYEPPDEVVARGGFDMIIGNPPFGGTFDPSMEDDLDKQYGVRNGHKIKKETYAFFIVKSLDMLREGGKLRFICSDTFLTINTMQGLRRLLMETGEVEVLSLSTFSEETDWGMVVLDLIKTGPSQTLIINGTPVEREMIESTANFSWGIDPELHCYFGRGTIGDVLVATSGMTTGRNEWFVRGLDDGGRFVEPYELEFFNEPIMLEKERGRARLGRLSVPQQLAAQRAEDEGKTRRNLRAVAKSETETLQMPHPDYAFYNKGGGRTLFYAPPTAVIYWRNEGEAVKTFKKAGSWYLHGVGGAPYFGREGITWPLISERIWARYLPPGYILDSGAPCGFLREDVDPDELYFVLGWLNTKLCSTILKRVINHTPNIQGKDIERLPYPWWVDAERRAHVIAAVKQLIERGQAGDKLTPDDVSVGELEAYFSMSSAEAAA